MEVISNSNPHNNSWGPQYHRYSNLSLVSAANSEGDYSLADQSFHTCCDGEDLQRPPSRVDSYNCLEDVQEEDMDVDTLPWASSKPPTVVPLRSYSQLQQQPLSSPPLTAARLVLSSDIGMLKRSLGGSSMPDASPAKAAQILMDRDQVMSCAAMPMSRSFAIPRATVGTAFRSCNSLASFASARGDTVAMDTDKDSLPPVVLTVKSSQPKPPPTKPPQLEDLPDDVQLQILSFVPLENVRSFMSANRRFRRLLFTRDAQNLWQDWCDDHQWGTASPGKALLVDDLSLPTAARPKFPDACGLSQWHHQANLSLLLSMAQPQPTEIDVVQLNEYTSHQQQNTRSRRRRSRHRIHTTDGNQPLLQYQEDKTVVQFTGRVGQGDRCVRANKAFPRPTLIQTGEWLVPPSQMGMHHRNKLNDKHNHSLLDLFCRSARAVSPPRPAWRPFVAPFFAPNEATAVHLTPRFVSYFEVSILEPTSDSNNSTGATDCVAVGVATESFDWHTRMPGWDSSSFGYHGDDGGIFHSSGGMLRKFGPSYGRGDVVGCGIDHVMRGIFFTLNGEFLGYAWTGLSQDVLERDLYPVVGIDTNDFIHCNFGTEPFQYDLKSLVVKHEELVHQSLSMKPSRRSTRSV